MNAGIGDTVRATGSHCRKGQVGRVFRLEPIEPDLYIHVKMEHTDETIIMRPGQYEIVQRCPQENTPETPEVYDGDDDEGYNEEESQ